MVKLHILLIETLKAFIPLTDVDMNVLDVLQKNKS